MYQSISFRHCFQRFFGARLQSAFLLGPGESIRDNADVAAGCGQPPAKRHQKIKGEPQILRPLRRIQDFG
jgi:hypothetical protein